MKWIKGSLVAITLAGWLVGCAHDDAHEDEPSLDVLAETFQPPPPAKSDMVNWNSAALEPSLNENSGYRRAQSIMAKLSAWAYDGSDEFSRKARDYGLSAIKQIHVVGGSTLPATVDAVWGANDHLKMAFLTVRGSASLDDYLTDFFAAPTFQGDGSPAVHAGFKGYADTIWNQLSSERSLACPPRRAEDQVPLWITGHSLGGAVATLLAKRFADAGCNVRGVSTFGSPKPGFDAFQSAYNNTRLRDGTLLGTITARWVNDKDPIPCLAPGRAWKHVGRQNAIDDVGLYLDTSSDACDTFDGTLAKFKRWATVVKTAAAVNVALAIDEWLQNKIILTIVCPAGTKVDDFLSLGLCTLGEYGTRLKDAFGMTPDELIGGIWAAAKYDQFHGTGDYTRGISALWDVPPGSGQGMPGASVTVKLPKDTDQRPVMTDKISGQWCLGDPDPTDRYWVCTFLGPLGSHAEIHIGTDNIALMRGCDYQTKVSDHELRCDVYLNSDREVSWQQLL